MAKISKHRQKEAVRTKLAQILQHASGNPKFESVTIVNIKLSPDSASAVVYFSMFGSQYTPGEVADALNAAAGFF